MLDFDELEIQEQSHQETVSNIVTRSLEERLSEICFNCGSYNLNKVFGHNYTFFLDLKYKECTNSIIPCIKVYTHDLHACDTTYTLRQEFYNFFISWIFDHYPDFIQSNINYVIHPEYLYNIPFNIDIHHTCHNSIQFNQTSFSKIFRKLDRLQKFLRDRDGNFIKLCLMFPETVIAEKMTDKEILRYMSRIYRFVDYGINHKKWSHVIESISVSSHSMNRFLDAYIRTGKSGATIYEMDYIRNYMLANHASVQLQELYYFLWQCNNLSSFNSLNSETEA